MRSVYTVAQVNSYIKNMFAQDYLLKSIWVKGEISNLKIHTSGHIYFTLKDDAGILSSILFAGYRSGLQFDLQNGQKITAFGSIDVYERDGKYQFYVRSIQLSGIGELYERFEQLKKELDEQGMFSPIYKKPFPTYVKVLGIVTASTGAAVHDIIQVAKRRNPYLSIILYPAIVQGSGAPASIANGIRALDRYGVDMMIVGRGGGSIEDLWAFNEKEVAQAAFDCTVPILSAVGHETDFTILDFVADGRAPTPSAAAELAVFEITTIEQQLLSTRNHLKMVMNKRLQRERMLLKQQTLRLEMNKPMSRLLRQRMDVAHYEQRLIQRMHEILLQRHHTLDVLREKLQGFSPMTHLKTGYAYVQDASQKQVRSVHGRLVGENLTVNFQDGALQVTIDKIYSDVKGE
ncbi:MAG: exodeoxyribonuclease VII large subunit [Clostridium sp.]|jgi:exodeoxyribonuclease VII large subunit|nr:exodeoxyribonuclease VII large subunit [Clostridium sp.]